MATGVPLFGTSVRQEKWNNKERELTLVCP